MKAYRILACALCACVFVAGCADKEKERADLAKVAELRESIAKQVVVLQDFIALADAEKSPGHMKREVMIERAKNILAKQADIQQIQQLAELSKEIQDASAEMQAIVDKRTEEIHKQNEENRKAIEDLRNGNLDALRRRPAK